MERFLENGRSSAVNIYNDCLKTNYNLAVTSTSVNFSFTPEKELPQIFQRNKNKIKKTEDSSHKLVPESSCLSTGVAIIDGSG